MIRQQEDAKANSSVLDNFRALAGMCDHRTEENFLKITKADHDKDLPTCPVNSDVRAGIRLGLRRRQWRRVGSVITAQRSMWRRPASRSMDQSDTSGLFWWYIARKAAHRRIRSTTASASILMFPKDS